MGDAINSKVDVCVRCRPLSAKEQMGKRCLTVANDTVVLGDKSYNFHRIFDETATQSSIYDCSVRSLIDGCFKGFNGTVFACMFCV
jgi:kinesin family member 21